MNFPAVLRGRSLGLLHVKVQLLYIATTVLAKQHLARCRRENVEKINAALDDLKEELDGEE